MSQAQKSEIQKKLSCETIAELTKLINECHSAKKSRSCNKLFQNSGFKYFNARGIQEYFGINYYEFLEQIELLES